MWVDEKARKVYEEANPKKYLNGFIPIYSAPKADQPCAFDQFKDYQVVGLVCTCPKCAIT